MNLIFGKYIYIKENYYWYTKQGDKINNNKKSLILSVVFVIKMADTGLGT